MHDQPGKDVATQPRRGRLKLLLVLLVCAAPVVASYLAYYVFPPQGRTNYGTLIDPQRPLPALNLHQPDGRVVDAQTLKGKWLLLMVDGGDCAKACQDKLYFIRQLRLTTGKNRDRVERVWMIPDQTPLSTILMKEYDGMHMLRAEPGELQAWLPPESGAGLHDHIFIVDPLGNLMMRLPRNPEPAKAKKDLSRLLHASGIG